MRLVAWLYNPKTTAIEPTLSTRQAGWRMVFRDSFLEAISQPLQRQHRITLEIAITWIRPLGDNERIVLVFFLVQFVKEQIWPSDQKEELRLTTDVIKSKCLFLYTNRPTACQ